MNKTEQIKRHFSEARQALEKFLSDEKNFTLIEQAGTILVNAFRNGNKVLTCGNGGSMCDAMHFAEELSGRYRKDRAALAAQSISDPAHLTCVANDWGFDRVFARGVEAWGRAGDTLVVFSTSGNSPNLIVA